MKVLVTGGCGFLGSHVCEFFREKGDEVIAYDNLTKHEFDRNPYMKPEARNYNKQLLENIGVRVVSKDIRDEESLIKHAKGSGYICHTAAQPAITISREDPELDFSTNTTGTFNVLNTARKLDIPVACCSSIHTYGPDKINSELREEETRYVREPVVIDEDEPLLQGAITPLHASKRSGEIYVQSFIDTFDLKAACFRLTGIYGPNQFGGEDHGWVANFAIRAMIDLPITIFGTGKQLRDILYATDVAEAFHCFYKSPRPGIYTIGGGKDTMISLLECINMIEEILDKKTKVKFEPERFADLRYFVADYGKFNQATGWKPKVKLNEGISMLIEWLKENNEVFLKK